MVPPGTVAATTATGIVLSLSYAAFCGLKLTPCPAAAPLPLYSHGSGSNTTKEQPHQQQQHTAMMVVNSSYEELSARVNVLWKLPLHTATANGSATNGSATNSSATNGSATNGSKENENEQKEQKEEERVVAIVVTLTAVFFVALDLTVFCFCCRRYLCRRCHQEQRASEADCADEARPLASTKQPPRAARADRRPPRRQPVVNTVKPGSSHAATTQQVATAAVVVPATVATTQQPPPPSPPTDTILQPLSPRTPEVVPRPPLESSAAKEGRPRVLPAGLVGPTNLSKQLEQAAGIPLQTDTVDSLRGYDKSCATSQGVSTPPLGGSLLGKFVLIRRAQDWEEVLLCAPLPGEQRWLCATTNTDNDRWIWAAVRLVYGEYILIDGIDKDRAEPADKQLEPGDRYWIDLEPNVAEHVEASAQVKRLLGHVPESSDIVAGSSEPGIPSIHASFWGGHCAIIKRGDTWDEVYLCSALQDHMHWFCSTTDESGMTLIWAAIHLAEGAFHLLEGKGASRQLPASLGLDDDDVNWIDESFTSECVEAQRLEEANVLLDGASKPIPQELFVVAGATESGIPAINDHIWRGRHVVLQLQGGRWREVVLCAPLPHVFEEEETKIVGCPHAHTWLCSSMSVKPAATMQTIGTSQSGSSGSSKGSRSGVSQVSRRSLVWVAVRLVEGRFFVLRGSGVDRMLSGVGPQQDEDIDWIVPGLLQETVLPARLIAAPLVVDCLGWVPEDLVVKAGSGKDADLSMSIQVILWHGRYVLVQRGSCWDEVLLCHALHPPDSSAGAASVDAAYWLCSTTNNTNNAFIWSAVHLVKGHFKLISGTGEERAAPPEMGAERINWIDKKFADVDDAEARIENAPDVAESLGYMPACAFTQAGSQEEGIPDVHSQLWSGRCAIIRRGSKYDEVVLCQQLQPGDCHFWLCFTTDESNRAHIWTAIELVKDHFFVLWPAGVERTLPHQAKRAQVRNEHVNWIDDNFLEHKVIEARLQEASCIAEKLHSLQETDWRYCTAGMDECGIPDVFAAYCQRRCRFHTTMVGIVCALLAAIVALRHWGLLGLTRKLSFVMDVLDEAVEDIMADVPWYVKVPAKLALKVTRSCISTVFGKTE